MVFFKVAKRRRRACPKQRLQKSEELQNLWEDEARELGKETGFVQRQSKMTGPKFVETLGPGLLERPEASLNELVGRSAELGVIISEPGWQERINSRAVRLLAGLLKKRLGRLPNQVALPGEGLQQFRAIYVLDSSIVTLPRSMQEMLAGFASPGSAFFRFAAKDSRRKKPSSYRRLVPDPA